MALNFKREGGGVNLASPLWWNPVGALDGRFVLRVDKSSIFNLILMFVVFLQLSGELPYCEQLILVLPLAVLLCLGNPDHSQWEQRSLYSVCQLAGRMQLFATQPTNCATILYRPFPWPLCEKPSKKPCVTSLEQDSESSALYFWPWETVTVCINFRQSKLRYGSFGSKSFHCVGTKFWNIWWDNVRYFIGNGKRRAGGMFFVFKSNIYSN